jgi:hypothetical protein
MESFMKRLIILIAMVLCFSASAIADEGKFTGWMTPVDLDNYFEVLNNGDTNSNYFEKGLRITAVEGRLNGSQVEYRVKIGDLPKNKAHAWFWWRKQTYAAFIQKMQEYEKAGFKLAHAQSFLMPDGTSRYQGVWYKGHE